MPSYRDASYGGESITLKNQSMTVEIHRRTTGWGWAEIRSPAGKLMGVLEHFGEIRYPGSMIPTRLEAADAVQTDTSAGQSVTFTLRETTWADMARRSPLHGPPYDRDDGTRVAPKFDGEMTLTLDPRKPVLRFKMKCRAMETVCFSSIRGPWLLAGAGDGGFGLQKDDAIFAGIDWCTAGEWSSGTDWFRHPWALRLAPDPLKVSAPFMAVSHDGAAIGMTWNPTLLNQYHWQRHYPQPVFASPNFVDRRDQHLMGLMFPAATSPHKENTLESEEGIAFLLGMETKFEGEIRLANGDSCDLMAEWVRDTGLPEPSPLRYELEGALDRIARAYDRHFWYEGKGWGMSEDEASPRAPHFLSTYCAEGKDRALAESLQQKLQWANEAKGTETREQLIERGDGILARQREDGSFPFDPNGVHGHDMSRANFVYCDDMHKPLGLEGETALDLCVVPAERLLRIAERTGEDRFAEGARRALDYCLPMRRPDGGDWWETPLGAPNLLAAGHAAVAYALAARRFEADVYRSAAVRWIRALLPFTQLWQPGEYPMLYNTKPCFTATCWQLSNWITWQVQWEVLQTFAASSRHGIDWNEVDPEIDWATFRDGVTIAALRWMIDHEEPGKTALLRDPVQGPKLLAGELDTLYHDIFDVTNGEYSGALILPDPIAENIQAMLKRRAGE